MRRSARRDSERFDHHQDHDQRHGHAGNLVEQPQLLARKRPLATLELAGIAAQVTVVARQAEDQRELGMEPALAPGMEAEGQRDPEDPDDRDRGPEDDLEQLALALDPL